MLKIKGLFKSFKNKEVLKGVDLHLKKGTITGLIGVNGAGKSTLIECVCGVKKIDAGEILIDNINVQDKKLRPKIKSIIGYTPQTFSLFNDLTVEENLGYLASAYDIDVADVKNTIDLCYLSEYKSTLARNLSGGYKQLLSLAAAIMHRPKLLILDEPTSSMDPIFRRKFWKVINDCKNHDTTVLVITHFMEELVECNSFICLSGGKISFSGGLSEFKQSGLLNIEEILKKYTIEDIYVEKN